MEHSQALSLIADQAQDKLALTHQAREQALPLSRKIIQLSAAAIRSAHRGEFDASRGILAQAKDNITQLKDALAYHPDLYHSGYVSDAQKEYAEGWATLAFLSGDTLSGPDELGIQMSAYLNGLAEAASELRRSILDALRRDDMAPCETWMQTMDQVYSLLITLDFPEAVTGGLRRTTDQLRGVLERTRGDLTMALRQHSLEKRLSNFQSSAGGQHDRSQPD